MPFNPLTAPAENPATAAELNATAYSLLLADTSRATELARSALLLAHRDGDLAQQTHAHLNLALLALRETPIDAGVAHLREAESLLDRHADPRARWIAQHVNAQWLRQQDRQPEALAVLTELHAQAARRPPLDAFYTVAALGIVQGIEGNHHAALVAFYEALALARRCDNLSVEVNALNNLGSFQLDLHNLEDARPLLERCLAGALELQSRRQTIFAAGNLLQCLCALGQPAEALALVRTHLVPNIRADDVAALQRDEEIAHALIENDLWDEARTYLARAPQADVLTNETSACRAWLEARVLMVDGDSGAALQRCLRQQATESDDSNVPLDRLRLAELAAEAACKMGNFRVAYEQQCRAYQVHHQLLGRAAKARFISLQIEHELQRTRGERDAARELAQRLEETNDSLQAQIVANEALQNQLRALALEDPLTGLYNRRHLFQAGAGLIAQARRQHTSVSVVLIDLDHFKLVNDRHGHDCGDQVLKSFAELARSMVRASDICCRYGGEEFVIVLAQSDADAAARRVRELLAAFRALRFASPGGPSLACSFSAGVSATGAAHEDLDALLRRADEALYRAKSEGRARVEVAGAG
jgi:two-component system, cell cycle response regulator